MKFLFNESLVGEGDKACIIATTTKLVIAKCAMLLGVPKKRIDSIDLNLRLRRDLIEIYSGAQQLEDAQEFLDLIDADYELNNGEEYSHQLILRFLPETVNESRLLIAQLMDSEAFSLIDYEGSVTWLDDTTIQFEFEEFIDEGAYQFVLKYYSIIKRERGL